jgi:hypothetical protein
MVFASALSSASALASRLPKRAAIELTDTAASRIKELLSKRHKVRCRRV